MHRERCDSQPQVCDTGGEGGGGGGDVCVCALCVCVCVCLFVCVCVCVCVCTLCLKVILACETRERMAGLHQGDNESVSLV